VRVYKVEEFCPKCDRKLNEKHICPKCKKSIPYSQATIIEVDEQDNELGIFETFGE